VGSAKGWATDPVESDFLLFPVKLPVGAYRVTETTSPAYMRLFHISARDATATVKVKVVTGPRCCPVPGCCLPAHPRPSHRARSLRRGPAVPFVKNPPPAALPDLVALPSWQISVSHPPKQARDFLDFAATMWIGGNGPLDVEGFRSHASPVMKAYQYFWRNGHVIGRARAGTMGFDSKRATITGTSSSSRGTRC